MQERSAAVPADPSSAAVDVIAFDVFGTVVDWHAGVAAAVRQLAPQVDGDAFALAWRAGYQPAMQQVTADIAAQRSGFVRIDVLHRQILDSILPTFGLAQLDEAGRRWLNRVWHRLPAWPDSVRGLARLKSRFTICTLSNGNIALLTDMAKQAGLPWDCILSAEVFRAYKPDPCCYLGVAELFDLAPSRVMLAAAHQEDLDAARACGLATAYLERPHEFGAARPKDVGGDARNTLHASDIEDLADQLGA